MREIKSKPSTIAQRPADTRFLMELVGYASLLGENDRPTFFYSPLLHQVEAIHFSGRKTFQHPLSPEILQQWMDLRIVRAIRPDQELLSSDAALAAVRPFAFRDEFLENAASVGSLPIGQTIGRLLHSILPEGWRCPLNARPGDPSYREHFL